MTSRDAVRTLSLALAVAVVAGSLGVLSARAQGPAAPDTSASDLHADTQRIARLFYAGQHEAVVRTASPLLARHGVTPTSLPIALFEAESQLQLGRRDEATRGYERTLPVIATLNNVEQRDFAIVFFRLALLAREKRQLDQALARTEAGLRLEPQNTWGQIFLGELFNERGDRARAVSHFKDVAAAAFPTNEERAVLAIKIDRLTTGKVGSSVQPPDVRGARVHEGLSIGLVPLQDLPKEVVLADVCVALEVAWRLHCEVLPSIAIPDADVFVVDRGQYDADRLLNELGRRGATMLRPGRYLMAVAGRDLFGPRTNYVFSWQTRGGESGIGVISAYRFGAALDLFVDARIHSADEPRMPDGIPQRLPRVPAKAGAALRKRRATARYAPSGARRNGESLQRGAASRDRPGVSRVLSAVSRIRASCGYHPEAKTDPDELPRTDLDRSGWYLEPAAGLEPATC